MYKDTADTARARIDVLVRTPARKVNTPIMQFNRNIAGSMRKVETNLGACLMSRFCNNLHIEHLAGVIIYSAEKYNCQFVGMVFY